MNETIKLKWLKSYLKSPGSLWHIFPDNLFNSLRGFNFPLKCDYNIQAACQAIQLSREVLGFWRVLYDQNLTPHSKPLQNNIYILCKNKAFFFKEWMNTNIWSVLDLLDMNGNLLTYNDLCVKLIYFCHPKQFVNFTNAIPKPFFSIPISINIVQTVCWRIPIP